MDRTVRGSIPQSKRNDLFRESANRLWSQPAAKACLWCIPCRHWGSPVPRDEGRYRATYSLCFKDIYQNGAKVFTDWQRSLVNNLGKKEVSDVFVWPLVQLVHRSSAVNVNLSCAEKHPCGHCSSTCNVMPCSWRALITPLNTKTLRSTVMPLVFPATRKGNQR